MDVDLSKLQETVEDGGAWPAAVPGSQRVGHDSATKQQQHSAFTERIQNVYATEDFRNEICFEERLSQVLSKLGEPRSSLYQRNPVRTARSWLPSGGARLAVACWDHSPTHCVPSTREPVNQKPQVSDRQE